MTPPTAKAAPEFVESDIPGREFSYPEGTTHVVFAQFGVQSDKHGAGESFVDQILGLFEAGNGPTRIERCHGDTLSGVHEDIVLAYWTDLDSYNAWSNSGNVTRWWASLPDDGPLGFWREVMHPEVDRSGFIGFGLAPDRLVACTYAMGAEPTEKFNYWGNYRDRTGVSKNDPLDSPLGKDLPAPIVRETLGRRVRIAAPHNLFFAREGCETTYVTDPLERRLWDTKLQPALKKWIAYLMANPRLSGAACTRDLVEQDLESGEDKEAYTQLLYMLTLRHLERAARTQPSHVGLYNTTNGMNEELAANGVAGSFIVWAEHHTLEQGTLDVEYVNCKPETGLLPWFDDADAASCPHLANGGNPA